MEYGIYSGIHMRAIGGELVPIQEEQETRVDARIGLDDWAKMDWMEKAILVAVRRNRNAIQNIHTEAEIKASERKMKQTRRR